MPTALAPAPTRAHTSFTLSWGPMVMIPCQVYTGTESTRVSRKEFVQDGDSLVEVGRSPIRKDDGSVVDQSEVGRYAQADNGEWVLLSDDEIAQCTSPRGLAEIVCFVPVKDVSNYLAEGQAQVRPKREKGKVNLAADRAFALLTTVMKQTKVVALVKIAMRGPARYALLDARGTFTLIHTADAIRQDAPGTSEYTFTKDEVAMGKMLVEAIGVDTPVLTDDTAPVVQEFVNAKSSGKPAPIVSAPPVQVDLMAALQASVAAKREGKVA
jgi:non-homologous end joining protein Ku